VPGVIRAIDLLLLPLTNVIHFCIRDEIKALLLFSIFATFYFAPPLPFKMGLHIFAQTHKIQTSRTCRKLMDLYIDVY
jgi:hypothetical protein